MSLCDETCRACIYSSISSAGICCDHILVTGQRRGCPAGAGCERRAVGERLPTIDELILVPKRAKERKEKPPKETPPKERRSLEGLTGHVLHKAKSMQKAQDELAGRQRAAILQYKTEHSTTVKAMAEAMGVKYKTVNSWAHEYCRADWDKLAILGIKKPAGLDGQRFRRLG